MTIYREHELQQERMGKMGGDIRSAAYTQAPRSYPEPVPTPVAGMTEQAETLVNTLDRILEGVKHLFGRLTGEGEPSGINKAESRGPLAPTVAVTLAYKLAEEIQDRVQALHSRL